MTHHRLFAPEPIPAGDTVADAIASVDCPNCVEDFCRHFAIDEDEIAEDRNDDYGPDDALLDRNEREQHAAICEGCKPSTRIPGFLVLGEHK